MTKGTFGESLKREREMRGVSLDEISAATRIATRFLQAIENEQWDQLPGGVFNRGFVRAVARYLGLDEENIVAEYVLAVGDRPSVPVWTGRPPAVTSEQPWAAWIIAGVVVIALIAGGWFAARRIYAWRAATRAAQNAAMTAAPSSAAPEMPANPVPAAASSDSTANPVATPETPSGKVDSSPVTNATSPATSPAMPPVPGRFELKVEAGKKTKVIVHADSDRVFDGTMKAGEDHTFTAKDRFEISARDAGALLLELNGKTLAPIGPPGHAGRVTVTREALKGAPGGEN
jgi:cytoskeleton protein RodZ